MPAPARSSATPMGPRRAAPAFVSVSHMATMLGCSQRYAYKLLSTGAIKSRYLGRRRLVDLSSLNAFIANLPTERD